MATKSSMTDRAVLAALGERIAQHRLVRNCTQAAIAKEAGVSKRTLVRLEGGESTQLTNLVRVLRALGLLENLDALVPAPASSPLDVLRSMKKQRKRATGRSSPPATRPPQPWTWGDEGTSS